MHSPSALNISSNPAPSVKSTPVNFSYEDICYASRIGVLHDFSRERRYAKLKESLRVRGDDVQMIPVNSDKADALVRASSVRLLKEHSSASWSVFFYQTGLFGLTGISSVATVMGFYLGLYHSRMFLPTGPMAAIVTWRLWNALEAAWEQQRYIDSTARLREERKGNPMNAVVKRHKKDSAASATDLEEQMDQGMEGMM